MAGKDKGVKLVLINVGWMLFDRVFILILNLLVTVHIANYYGRQGYGTYQYAVSVIAIFDILIAFVDSRVIKKAYNSQDASTLVWEATLSRILFSAVALIIGFIYILISRSDVVYNTIFFLLLCNSIVLNAKFGMQNRYEFILQSKKIIIASNISYIIGGALQFFAVTLKLEITVIAFIAVFSSAISLVIVYIQYRKDFGKLKIPNVKFVQLKPLIKESMPLAIAASCAVIYSRCDSIMIGNMLSMSDVGIYAISVKLISIVQIALSPIRESVYPKLVQLYSNSKKEYEVKYIQISSALTWIYIIGVSASLFILPVGFKVLKPDYYEALSIYNIYVIGIFFMYNAALRAGHYTLINRGNILMYTQIISVLLNIVLNIVLIKFLGLYGAAIATVLTQSLSLMVSNLFWGEDGRQVFIWQLKAINPINLIKLLSNKSK